MPTKTSTTTNVKTNISGRSPVIALYIASPLYLAQIPTTTTVGEGQGCAEAQTRPLWQLAEANSRRICVRQNRRVCRLCQLGPRWVSIAAPVPRCLSCPPPEGAKGLRDSRYANDAGRHCLNWPMAGKGSGLSSPLLAFVVQSYWPRFARCGPIFLRANPDLVADGSIRDGFRRRSPRAQSGDHRPDK